MIRVSVLYPASEGKKFDVDYYKNKHMKLATERLKPFGLIRTEVDKGVAGGTPGAAAPYVAVCHFYFNAIAVFHKGMGSYVMDLIVYIPIYSIILPHVQ